MGLRFRRSVSLFPGVRLNLSPSGISTTIGGRGLSVNVGRQGTHLNLGVPGTGLSFRTKISPSPAQVTPPRHPSAVPVPDLDVDLAPTPEPIPATSPGEIKSAEVSELTSPGLGELKRLINEATVRRGSLTQTVASRKSALEHAKARLARAQRFLIRIFTQKRIPSLAADVAKAQALLEEAQAEREACAIDVDFAFDHQTLDAFAALIRAFREVSGCNCIWDVTASVAANRVAERTTASFRLTRSSVQFQMASSEVISSKYEALRLENVNGDDLYIYPGYVMLRSQGHDFALIDVRELEVSLEQTNFIEEESVPPDTETIGSVWKKANKDGSPDRRFTDNYQIPLVRYGQIWLRSPTGLRECYMVSSFPKAQAFVAAIQAYQSAVTASSKRATSTPQNVDDDAIGSQPLEEEASAPDGAAAPVVKSPSLLPDYVVLALLLLTIPPAAYWASQHDFSGLTMASSTTSTPTPPTAPPVAPLELTKPASPPRERIYVQGPAANVRAEPSGSGKVVGVENRGKELSVFGRQGEWVQVGTADKATGWIHRSLLGPKQP